MNENIIPDSTSATSKNSTPTEMSRRTFLNLLGGGIFAAMLGTTTYKMIDSSMAVFNIMNALKVKRESGPLAELTSIVKGIENAHQSAEAFFERTKEDYPLSDIYAKQQGEYRSKLFLFALIQRDVLSRLWSKVQILVGNNKILRLLGKEETIIATIKKLHTETIQELYPFIEQDAEARKSMHEFLELGNLIGFWTDHADWGIIHPCYASGSIIGFDPKQDQKILEALRFVRNKTIACADQSKSNDPSKYEFRPITSKIVFGELNPSKLPEGSVWVDVNATRIWAHESAHFMDITINPALMKYLTLAQYEELCALRAKALVTRLREYFTDVVQTTDWVFYLKDHKPALMTPEHVGEFLRNLYSQVDYHFFTLGEGDHFFDSWPSLFLPMADNQEQLVNGLRTEDCGNSRKAKFALAQILKNQTEFGKLVDHASNVRGTGGYSEGDLYFAGETVYKVLEKLAMRAFVEGDDLLYSEFAPYELDNFGLSCLDLEREHFAEVIGMWVTLQNDNFDIPNKRLITRALEELPEIQYAIRLRQCLNLDSYIMEELTKQE